MAGRRKPCTKDGCETLAVKEGLCYRCFKEKYGVAPYPMQSKTKKKTITKKRRSNSGKQTGKDLLPVTGEIVTPMEIPSMNIEGGITLALKVPPKTLRRLAEFGAMQILSRLAEE